MSKPTYSELTPFASPWYLRVLLPSHSQTVALTLVHKIRRWLGRRPLEFHRERWDIAATPQMPVADFIDVDFYGDAGAERLLVLFHGLEGCSDSPYARAIAEHAKRAGWWIAIPHFRGCSYNFQWPYDFIPNEAPRFYHNADSAEVDWILRRFREQYPNQRLYAAGVSLGGNVLLKWLGEQGEAARGIVQRAVAVSAPINIGASGLALGRGLKRLYTRNFLDTLKRKTRQKWEKFRNIGYQPDAVDKTRTFYEFDNLVTAPVHGFKSQLHYWYKASSWRRLKDIRVPTLMLNARNDPFLPEHKLLAATRNAAPCVVLEFPRTGGHAGFFASRRLGGATWLPRRVFEFLEK